MPKDVHQKKGSEKAEKSKDISLGQYQHATPKRTNNPPVGLVSNDLDSKPVKKTYQHDPYIEPSLSWAGKQEGLSFDVDTVSLHIHERIDPKRVIKQVLKKTTDTALPQPSLFEQASENLTTEREFDFYSHQKNWSNRLIAGDSLLVMNSLIEKERMAGTVQTVYIDPPYGITFNSNFQPFVNKKEVKDKDDDSIPAEPEMIKAFRDTWELNSHSYLTYLRDRLLLAKELLHESGSCFVQINDENLHYVRNVMEEIFGKENYISSIIFTKKGNQKGGNIQPINDNIVWFAKDKSVTKFRPLFIAKSDEYYNYVEFPDGKEMPVEQLRAPNGDKKNYLENQDEFSKDYPGAKLFQRDNLTSGGFRKNQSLPFTLKGHTFAPSNGNCWKTTVVKDDGSKPGMDVLAEHNRISIGKTTFYFKRYASDFGYSPITNIWTDTGGVANAIYVVQTSEKVIQRCIQMTSDPGDLILDITCGSGTTALVSENLGRRWITCDTSRVAVQLAKQRLMTAKFDFFEMAKPDEGVSSGFKYKTVPHVTLGSIANGEPAKLETLFDQPLTIKNKVRVTGPFTVEAVPGVRTRPISGNLPDTTDKTNPTNPVSEKLADYLDSVRTSGIRSYHNEGISFSSVEVSEGFNEIHAFASIDTNGEHKKCAIVFGPDYAPMEQTQIERTLNEVRSMQEKPQLVIFCSYAFDPEASKDIDNIKIDNLQILKAQMNTDLLTKDLKKKANTNRPFWLIGEPDIEISKLKDGKYQVEVKGFDYYDPTTQELKGGGTDKIALWMLDTDYDNRSLFPSQIFFPMQDERRDWTKLAKALNGTVDVDLLEQYTGTKSIPFTLAGKKTIAIKIVDDRGVEMLIVKKM